MQEDPEVEDYVGEQDNTKVWNLFGSGEIIGRENQVDEDWRSKHVANKDVLFPAQQVQMVYTIYYQV